MGRLCGGFEYMNRLILGDCLEVMKDLEAGSIDMVLTDPPYGTTACVWDSVINLNEMWEQLKRLIKKNGAIVLTSQQPFTTKLINSNMEMFKYNWIWQKKNAANFLSAKFQPLRVTEDVLVFSYGGVNNGSKNPMCYYPVGARKISKNNKNNKGVGGDTMGHNSSLKEGKKYIQTQTNYPKNIIKVGSDSDKIHPTQKPVGLMRYLIETYTKKGEVVLDFTMGSGTTGVACKMLDRDFIGIEIDETYFNIAKKRIESHIIQERLL